MAHVTLSLLSSSSSVVVVRGSQKGCRIVPCLFLLLLLSARVAASSSSAEPHPRTGDDDDEDVGAGVRHYAASSATYLPPPVDAGDLFSSVNAEGNTSYRRHHLKRRRFLQQDRLDNNEFPSEGECPSNTATVAETIIWLTFEGLTGPIDEETIEIIEREIMECVNAASRCIQITEVEVLGQWYDGPVFVDERRLERKGGIAAFLKEGGDGEMEDEDSRRFKDGGAGRNLARRRYFASRLTFKLRKKGICYGCRTRDFLKDLEDGLRRGLLGPLEDERLDPVYFDGVQEGEGGRKGEWSRRVQNADEQDQVDPNEEALFLEMISSCLESTLLKANWGLTASLAMIGECLSKVSFYKTNPRCYWEKEELRLEGEGTLV